MSVIGIGSAVMSAYHTSAFLFQGGKPLWTSALTGIMLILFSGTAFTAARYVFQEKRTPRLFGWFFVVTGLVIITYSMFSTVAVNFNQFKRLEDEKASAAAADSGALATHETLIAETKAAIEEMGEERQRLVTEADYWRSKFWKHYDSISAQIADVLARRNALQEKLERLEERKPDVIEQAAASRETVYTFLARLIGLPEDIAKFFVYVIPACLYDILAPFALSLVLLLADARQKEKVEAEAA